MERLEGTFLNSSDVVVRTFFLRSRGCMLFGWLYMRLGWRSIFKGFAFGWVVWELDSFRWRRGVRGRVRCSWRLVGGIVFVVYV